MSVSRSGSGIHALTRQVALITGAGRGIGREIALGLARAGASVVSAAVLPAMRSGGWGRIVNVSSGIVGAPEMMIGGTVYAATKAALEAHTVNLAAEVAGSGVTVNVYRPGIVDTSMQEGIRSRSPEEIGSALHERFTEMHTNRSLITPAASAAALLDRLPGDQSGEIWSFGDG